MPLRPLAATAAALSLAACATVPTDTAPIPLPHDFAATSHVGVVRMTSDWVRADETFPDTFTEELHDSLRACAQGPRDLDLRLHVSKVRRASRLGALLRGGGEHELRAIAEFTDPRTRAVVGRYPIHVVVDAGNPAQILLADRQMITSDAFATELCRQTFGRG